MAEKPSLPEGYAVPKVWKHVDLGGVFGSMNQPTAGKRADKELPRGDHPLQLYSLGTPNGHKVTILLEELGLEYDAWIVNIQKLEQFNSGFVAVNPNSKIPCMLDYSYDEKEPLRLFESGAILKYLAEKEGRFIPTDPRARVECFNWLFWQMGSAPMIGGGFGHFYKYAPVNIQYCVDRYSLETKRLLDVLDKHLAGKEYVCGGEYTIADMAIFPWVRCIDVGYSAAEFLQLKSYENVMAWMERISSREAVKRGLRVNGFTGPDAVPNRHSKADFETTSSL